jgi:hypothetical protein
MHACAQTAQQQRTSTRAKAADTAKKSAMAELVAAKAARAQRSDQKRCAHLEHNNAFVMITPAPAHLNLPLILHLCGS